MATRRSTDAVIKMATKEAKRLSAQPASDQAHDPKLVQAVEQVWSLVQDRLGDTAEAKQLDELIQSVVKLKPEQIGKQ
jgi:hypothetical protein